MRKRGRPPVPYRTNSNPLRVEKKARVALENIVGGAEEVPSLLQALCPKKAEESTEILDQLTTNIQDLLSSLSSSHLCFRVASKLCKGISLPQAEQITGLSRSSIHRAQQRNMEDTNSALACATIPVNIKKQK